MCIRDRSMAAVMGLFGTMRYYSVVSNLDDGVFYSDKWGPMMVSVSVSILAVSFALWMMRHKCHRLCGHPPNTALGLEVGRLSMDDPSARMSGMQGTKFDDYETPDLDENLLAEPLTAAGEAQNDAEAQSHVSLRSRMATM
eukprot:TRINITY_DN32756_c0_g1_i1.p1 TRINITY_DN32756_c0_g1~~TRINITY_DN32756_c0_g1_i1.p1  ORF type:complete len:141 (-),score=30.05 TRINITY_DN32756_c0_g1_i1:103-525(-)